MSFTTEMILRLLLGSVLGAAIGLERDFRAKEAGMRTHFLVALGSTLLMIVSQWGFAGCITATGVNAADSARVAAQIVSGIGFLGAGTIMMRKQSIQGLTTAAGLWVAAAIGMAVGGGLYILALVTTALSLIGLEILALITVNVKTKGMTIVFTVPNRDILDRFIQTANEKSIRVLSYSVKHSVKSQRMKIQMFIREHPSMTLNGLIMFIQHFPEIHLEKVE